MKKREQKIGGKMIKLTGKGASLGMAEGAVCFYRKEKEVLDEQTNHVASEEEKKLADALEKVRSVLEGEREIAEKEIGKEEADVFMIHRMMLDDADFLSAMQERVAEGYSAAYAADSAAKALAAGFQPAVQRILGSIKHLLQITAWNVIFDV